jgi:hypothetical protein
VIGVSESSQQHCSFDGEGYKPFTSLSAFTTAGGRLPKYATKRMDNAVNEVITLERGFVALYDRSDWPHWSDSDNDCQKMRHELLIANSNSPVSYKNDKPCWDYDK